MLRNLLVKEVTAPTVEQAVDNALEFFGSTRAEVDVDIVKVPSRGFFGLFCASPATVHVRLIDRSLIAKRITETILSKMDFEASVSVATSSQSIDLEVHSRESALLIGKHGQTLDALRYMVISLSDRVVSDRKAITIDIDGYSERRRASIFRMARRISSQVRRSRKPVTTQALSSEERRLFHQYVKNEESVDSRSVGQGNERKIIVSLRKE